MGCEVWSGGGTIGDPGSPEKGEPGSSNGRGPGSYTGGAAAGVKNVPEGESVGASVVVQRGSTKWGRLVVERRGGRGVWGGESAGARMGAGMEMGGWADACMDGWMRNAVRTPCCKFTS